MSHARHTDKMKYLDNRIYLLVLTYDKSSLISKNRRFKIKPFWMNVVKDYSRLSISITLEVPVF